MDRRHFIASVIATAATSFAQAAVRPRNILLRSSWQTVNIGDIAHTPGMLALLEIHLPNDVVTLWPKGLNAEVEQLLKRRFPKLAIVRTQAEHAAAVSACDLFLHGSGPGLVGAAEAELARKAGKPYGFAGITLSDEELVKHRDLLANAKFVFTRDTESLKALNRSGIKGPLAEFGPDATFCLDLKDDAAAARILKEHQLEPGAYLCAIPRLRWTPYWEINPETTKPNPERSAVNEAFAERDHAKMREAICAWVRETRQKVFIVPEMTYQVSRIRPLLYDPLPPDVKASVVYLDRYWLTAEAASVYARASAVLSFELHSPIIAITAGTPAVLLRQPTDTRKGQMWRDIGLDRWIFEIDETDGRAISERVLEIGRDPAAARKLVAQAQTYTQARMAAMTTQIDKAMA